METTEEELPTPELALPSRSGLFKATAIAAAAAFLVLLLAVLPAEYDIDPTGFGAAIGLTRLSSATEESAAEPPSSGVGSRRASGRGRRPGARREGCRVQVQAWRG